MVGFNGTTRNRAMADFPFNNERSQAERQKVLENDRKVRSTYFQHAQTDPDLELGGRFKKLIPSVVVGTGAGPVYPQQPEGSPWAKEPIGTEPPLGYSVEDHEPVGELHERGDGSATTALVVEEVDPAVRPIPAGSTSKKFRRRI